MRIAIVEDDLLQRTTLHNWLQHAGHHCDSYRSGTEFIEEGRRADYQLMLFDWGLPGISGMELLDWLRSQQQDNTPVIFVTAHDAEEEIVKALRHGADDYLVKPARRKELLARIDALLRRATPQIAVSVHRFGNIEVDTLRQEITLDGEMIELTQKEYNLAHYLLENSGKLLSRHELLENVWGHNHDLHTRTVDTHISRLRKKLRLTREQGWHLGAVYQYGYRLDNLSH
jgi:two-component system response regulator RegX3